jgi:hypothetical protein
MTEAGLAKDLQEVARSSALVEPKKFTKVRRKILVWVEEELQVGCKPC